MDGKLIRRVWNALFHESMENDGGDPGDAERSARHQSGELSAPHLAGRILPQFINVLTGGMSIVGPRLHAVAMIEQYQFIEGYMLRC